MGYIVMIKWNLLECFNIKSYLILISYQSLHTMADLQKANEFKALGNEAFKNKNYQQAI